jgi:hypothetical protein
MSFLIESLFGVFAIVGLFIALHCASAMVDHFNLLRK